MDKEISSIQRSLLAAGVPTPENQSTEEIMTPKVKQVDWVATRKVKFTNEIDWFNWCYSNACLGPSNRKLLSIQRLESRTDHKGDGKNWASRRKTTDLGDQNDDSANNNNFVKKRRASGYNALGVTGQQSVPWRVAGRMEDQRTGISEPRMTDVTKFRHIRHGRRRKKEDKRGIEV